MSALVAELAPRLGVRGLGREPSRISASVRSAIGRVYGAIADLASAEGRAAA